ncbi:hypothetical protein I2492_02155 [Budviciaceae bacterium CWB-B4]|uniref:Type II secretion system protein GspC N-terminal domain-containing protein n=2 Tax=Limnobaculum xujianqingii TaxID=2738837 RepID=A0A9D7FQP6_9GAMM|nr:hypothetical protein [Limnobaculum xujianqingii]MBK5175128.1 hypothetical protein [Limnobaculum xujianqingii]
MQMNIVNKYTVPALIAIVFGFGAFQAYHTYDNHKSYALSSMPKHPRKAVLEVTAEPANLTLFNQPTSAAKTAVQAPPVAVEVSAIVYSDDTDLSMATLKQGSEEINYRVGEMLKGYSDVFVDSIDKDSIHLRNKGNMETVKLKQPDYMKGHAV